MAELVECSKCGRKNRIADLSRGTPRCGFCKEPLVAKRTDDAGEEIVEAPLTYWRSLYVVFVLNVVASVMTLVVVFLIMIPVALSLALTVRAGLVVLEPAFRSALPFAEVCALIFGGLPWAIRLCVRRGMKFLHLGFKVTPHRTGNGLRYSESLKVAWAYMWPNFIVVAVVVVIAGEIFQVFLPLAIFLQPVLFRRAFNRGYRNFSLTAQIVNNFRLGPLHSAPQIKACLIVFVLAACFVILSGSLWLQIPFGLAAVGAGYVFHLHSCVFLCNVRT